MKNKESGSAWSLGSIINGIWFIAVCYFVAKALVYSYQLAQIADSFTK